MLSNFYEEIVSVFTLGELLPQLKSLKDLLHDYLQSEDFYLAIIRAIVSSIQEEKVWQASHLFYHEKLKFSVRPIFWPGFYENNPHQHRTWSVTGVLHNCLDVQTYEKNALGNLRSLRRIRAAKGGVGYLVPGCIHNINNPSHAVSASLHIFNNLNIAQPEENAIWYPAPRKHKLILGLKERALEVCLKMVANIQSESTLPVINAIYQELPLKMKYLAIQEMYAFNKVLAKEKFEELSEILESN